MVLDQMAGQNVVKTINLNQNISIVQSYWLILKKITVPSHVRAISAALQKNLKEEESLIHQNLANSNLPSMDASDIHLMSLIDC